MSAAHARLTGRELAVLPRTAHRAWRFSRVAVMLPLPHTQEHTSTPQFLLSASSSAPDLPLSTDPTQPSPVLQPRRSQLHMPPGRSHLPKSSLQLVSRSFASLGVGRGVNLL